MWVAIFEPPGLTDRVVAILIDALYQIDLDYLTRHPRTPHLYASGVYYRAEAPGQERWRSVPWVLKRGHGDCEDLACWLAAQHTLRGSPARPVARRGRLRGGKRTYHIVVQRSDGRIEDPSRRLGM